MDHSPFTRTFESGIFTSIAGKSILIYILQCFATKLHNFTKFRMLFPAVLTNIPNSKVCLKGEWSTEILQQILSLSQYQDGL